MGACVSKSGVSDAELPGKQALPSKNLLNAATPHHQAAAAAVHPAEHRSPVQPALLSKQPLTPGTPQQDTIPAKLAFGRAEVETPAGAPPVSNGPSTPPTPLSQARQASLASQCLLHSRACGVLLQDSLPAKLASSHANTPAGAPPLLRVTQALCQRASLLLCCYVNAHPAVVGAEARLWSIPTAP